MMQWNDQSKLYCVRKVCWKSLIICEECAIWMPQNFQHACVYQLERQRISIRWRKDRNGWQPNNVNKPSRHELNNKAIDTRIIHIWHALCTTSSPSSSRLFSFVLKARNGQKCFRFSIRIYGPFGGNNVKKNEKSAFEAPNRDYFEQWGKLHTIIFRV